MNSVEIGRPNIDFSDVPLLDLLNLKKYTVEVYYNDFPNYRQVTYTIEFFYSKSTNWILYTSASIIMLLFIGLVIVCIWKAKKAMQDSTIGSIHSIDSSLVEPIVPTNSQPNP